MENIFVNIMERIADRMPELSLIDEDYGQLEMGIEEDHYPVTFPCVLIGETESDWNDLGGGAQNGEALINIRIAIDCYHDAGYASGTYDKTKERYLLAKKLYQTLQGFEPTEYASELVRVKEKGYWLPHYVKVYEYTFSFSLHDESAMEDNY